MEEEAMCETISSSDSAQPVQQFQEFLSNDELHSEAVMSHIFGINRREARAYSALHNQGENTAKELAETLDRHPNNVYKALTGLCESGLATRRQRILDHGGQEYVFSAVSVRKATEIMENKFNRWVAQARHELKVLESPPK